MRRASTPDLEADPQARDARVRRLGQAFVTDEAMAALRHDLLSHLTGIGTVTYLLRKHVDDGGTVNANETESEPAAKTRRERRGSDLLGMIKEQVTAATAKLQRTLVAPPDRAHPKAPLAMCAARARASLVNPDEVVVRLPKSPDGADALVAAANDVEVEIAMACLLANAVEATAGVPGGEVRVALERASGDGSDGGQDAAFIVDDAGAGFSEADVARAFDPFYTTKPEHLGLGLTVARRIAQRWGGSVVLEPRTGAVGAANRVTMRLPLARPGLR